MRLMRFAFFLMHFDFVSATVQQAVGFVSQRARREGARQTPAGRLRQGPNGIRVR